MSRIELVAEGVIDTLGDWARARAAAEGVEFGEWMSRLIDDERRRVEGRPRRDSRTVAVGRRGAHAHMAYGELSTTQVARRAGVSPIRVGKWRTAKVLETVVATAKGSPARFAPPEALIAGALVELDRLGFSTTDAAARLLAGVLRTVDGWRDKFVVINDGVVAIVGPSWPLAHQSAPAIVVLSLGAIEAGVGARGV